VIAAPTLATVGPGRVGWALSRAAAGAGYTITGVAGGTGAARERLARALGTEAADRPEDLAADIVLLCVPDPALRELAARLRSIGGAALVHTAGALPAAALGIDRAGSFHPLRSFAGEPRDVDLAGCGAAIDADGVELLRQLESLAAALAMHVLHVPPAGRARYHAAAVLAGNAPAVLLESALRQLIALDVPREAASRSLAALLASVAGNAAALGPAAALSGPIRRGDADTVAVHLATLDAADPPAAALYRALGRATLGIAAGLPNGPDPRVTARLTSLLADPGLPR
jgi:predicted short-subunit dehydrogenase-like oxidoreductase (DUF2520 family)